MKFILSFGDICLAIAFVLQIKVAIMNYQIIAIDKFLKDKKHLIKTILELIFNIISIVALIVWFLKSCNIIRF